MRWTGGRERFHAQGGPIDHFALVKTPSGDGTGTLAGLSSTAAQNKRTLVTRVSAGLTTQSTSRPNPPAGGPSSPTPPNPLDLKVEDLWVPRTGHTTHLPASGLPLVVIDPHGNEVVWVSRALRYLQGECLAPTTLEAYAKHMLRGLRVIWAAGYDPVTLTGVEFSVVRRWLLMCLRHNSAPVPGSAVRHLAPVTVNNTVTAMRRIYDAAMDIRLVEANPVAAFDGPLPEPTHDQTYDTGFRHGLGRRLAKVQEKVVITLSDEQTTQLRERESKLVYRAVWHLMLDSGPRISEVLSLDLDHYHPEQHTAEVIGKGLGGERRTIPICDRTITEINAYLASLEAKGIRLAGNQPMFLSLQTPYPPLTYNAVWKALRYRLQDRHIHPHALRHTAATELLNLLPGTAQQNILNLRITLGHKHTSTTQRYLHRTVTETVIAHIEARNRPLDPAHPVLADTFGPDELALLAEIRNEQGEQK